MSALGLYRLLAPYFLVGFTFPAEADTYLSKLGVTDLTAVSDDTASVVTGTLLFGDAPREHKKSDGKGGFRWDDVEVRFRLTVPRDGAGFIDTAAHALPSSLGALTTLLDRFHPVDQTATAPTEYPGVRFRLELLLDELHFELSDDWRPGLLDADHRISRDATSFEPVRIVLPRIALSYEQTDDFQSPPALRLVSWGGGGFDAPTELLAGELVRMEPPIAAHRSGRLGFGLGAVIVDLDPDNTPPEILQFFGTDESFEGIYVQSARLYYADQGKDIAVNAAVKDLLVSFEGVVSFDASVDLIGPQSTLSAALVVVDGGANVPVSPGATIPPNTLVTGGKVKASTAARVQLQVTGGVPPVTVSVKDEGDTERFDTATGTVTVSALASGEHTLQIAVTDSGPGTSQQTYSEDVGLTLVAASTTGATPPGAPADRRAEPGDLPAITTSGGGSGANRIRPGGTVTGTTERFLLDGPGTPTVTANGQNVQVVDGAVTVNVPENTANLQIVAAWPALTGEPQDFTLSFSKGWPHYASYGTEKPKYLSDASDADPLYEQSARGGQSATGTAAVHAWLDQLATAGGAQPNVTVDAFASFESLDRDSEDQTLSERRRDVALGAIGTLAQVTGGTAHGFHDRPSGTGTDQQIDRIALIHATVTQAAATVTLQVSRGARSAPAPGPAQPTPPPSPLPNKPPGVFRRVGIRVKVLRNQPVLLQLSGQLDFETDAEAKLRNPSGSAPITGQGSLGLKQQAAAVAGANPNPKDGVTDFTITVVHDPATHTWTETLQVGAHPDDVDGLLQLTNPHTAQLTVDNRLKDMLGSVMILAPIIGVAVGATDPNTAGSYAVLGGTLVGAAAIGAAGFLRTEKMTLYGGEMHFREVIPPSDPAQLTDWGVLFDYGVEFGVDIDALGIKTTKPLKVRYRALGFNLNFAGGGYQPIFDTSKGYELDLSDPGLFKLPSPIDNVLKIFGARIAKVNPLTVELDLGMKVDLGVVKIDRFKVKLPIDPPGVPTILPSAISVNISQVLVGSGFVNIIEPPAAPAGQEQPGFGGIEGGFDVSLVPVKLRIAASFGVRPVSSGQRTATAVFLGLIVDLPAPIPLAQSGLGIYGFSGLFAMHYKRLESDPDPTDAKGPAILWLKAAGGEPAKLFNNGVELWGPELDRWSFGIGVSLGTTEGGFLINLRGMLVLELPGPRILVFVKVTIVGKLESLKPAADLDIGILGVIDLDFAQHRITVGIIVDLEIKEIVAVSLPIELFFDLQNLANWHLFVGTFSAPATAMVLGIVKGTGYQMISGSDIANWPGYGTTRTLNGIAFAVGIGASVVFGDEGIGLYLKVSARADIAVTFSPRLHLVGRVQLDGELRLFIISIGAHGKLDVEATDPTHLEGEICGHVDFFFFSVEGCVKVSIGDVPPLPPAPELVANVWLQSHAPIITAGQGGDRPIDASLGDAARDTTGTLPVVPIDAVPVVQFMVRPVVGSGMTTFTQPLVTAPGLPPGGWVDLSKDRKVSYTLTGLRLQGAPLIGAGTPPAAWRPEPAPTPVTGTTRVDLALLSNVPLMGARALERSLDLDAIVDGVFGQACDPVAPPASVLWTFCDQPLGPSSDGWDLPGIAWPDPQGTIRTTAVDTGLEVDEAPRSMGDELVDVVIGQTAAGRIERARVIGPNGPVVDPPGGGGDPPGTQVCLTLAEVIKDGDQNPSPVGDLARVTTFDARGMASRALRTSGFGGQRGLDAGWRTLLELLVPTSEVTLTLVTFAQPSIVAAYDTSGAIVMKARAVGKQGVPEDIVLSGPAINRVVIQAPADETLLLRLCVLVPAGRPIDPPQPFPVGPLPVGPFPVKPFPIGPIDPGRLVPLQPAPIRAGLAPSLTRRPMPVATSPAPVGTPAGAPDLACMRALQLPERRRGHGKGEIPPSPELKIAGAKRVDDRWIDLVTGPFSVARLYLAVANRLNAGGAIVVEQLDASGATLTSDPLGALSPVAVSGTTGLPASWTDPTGPWAAEVMPVVALLADPSLASLDHVLVSVAGDPAAVRLRVRVQGGPVPEHPAAVLAVVEVLTTAEVDRADTEEASRSGTVTTLAGYLNGTAAVPLLTPNTDYTLLVDYTATTSDTPAGGGAPAVTSTSLTRSFLFHTDAAPPSRLDAYVLATLPRHEEQFVFADEAMTIVFNDLQVVNLFAAYGRTLVAVLRGADGIAIPSHEVKDITEVPATYSSPLYDTLDAQVAAGEHGCVGSYHREGHGSFLVPEPLRPSMAYTLDIEAQPVPAPAANLPIVPLFRRQFRTGRFGNLGELVTELTSRELEHVALTGPITGLATGEQADVAIEAALLAAGLPVSGPASRGRRVVLWRPTAGGFRPHALLLDASEPLWRWRDAPAEQTPDPNDPSYVRIVPGVEAALRLEAAAPVTGFVRSPGGTRTIVLIDDTAWPSGGATVTVEAVRPATTLYGLAEVRTTVTSILLGGRAPWEGDDG